MLLRRLYCPLAYDTVILIGYYRNFGKTRRKVVMCCQRTTPQCCCCSAVAVLFGPVYACCGSAAKSFSECCRLLYTMRQSRICNLMLWRKTPQTKECEFSKGYSETNLEKYKTLDSLVHSLLLRMHILAFREQKCDSLRGKKNYKFHSIENIRRSSSTPLYTLKSQ